MISSRLPETGKDSGNSIFKGTDIGRNYQSCAGMRLTRESVER